MYNRDIQHTTLSKENMMNFNEICQLAETTRDEIYGLRIGSDRFGYDAVMFYDDIVDVPSDEPTESEYRKYKREKAENVAVYRAAVESTGEFCYDNAANRDEITLNNNEIAWVGAMIKAGLIDEITEDDLIDG